MIVALPGLFSYLFFFFLSRFYVESSIKARCCEAVIAAIVKPCIEIVLDIFFRHSLWPSALDLDITFEWLSWFYVESSTKVRCCETVIAASVKPCIVIVLDILFKDTLCSGATDLDIALEWLSWFNVESSIKVCFCVALIAAGVKIWIVIVLDILFKHTLWHVALDLDIALEYSIKPSLQFSWFVCSLTFICHDFTSILPLKCILCGGDSCACQTSHSNCLWPAFQAPTWPCAIDLDFALQRLCPMQVRRRLSRNSCTRIFT